jgi:hypothetical protein
MSLQHAEILLKHNEELEARQEKLAALLVQHDEELNRLIETLPELRKEVLEATLPDLTAKLDAAIPALVSASVDGAKVELSAEQRTSAEELGRKLTEIRAELVATVREGLQTVQNERQRIVSLAEIRETLAEIARETAETTAKAQLSGAQEQISGEIRALLAEKTAENQTELALGNDLVSLFRGPFKPGMQAKRGEIWTFVGSTYICLADTDETPTRKARSGIGGPWALLAAAGAGGGGSSGGGGDSLPSQAGNSGKFLTTDGTTPSWEALAGGGDMLAANNLSDVADAATAFDNIKQLASTTYRGVVAIGTSATHAAAGDHLHTGVYDPAGSGATEAASAVSTHVGQADPHTQYALESALGDAAAKNTGTTAGTVAAGNDSRFSDARTPTAHAASHTNGTDDIQSATASQKGLATAAQITKLDGIETAADVTDAGNVGEAIDGATGKTTPVDADTLALIDSVGTVLKKLTWANLKTTLASTFQAAISFGTGVLTALGVNVGTAGSVVVNGGALGTPSSGTLTNATGLPTGGLVNAAVTLAKMANLAQDQFIGRTTASTGVPETATITAAARTVLDDTTVSAMVDTLGGASATGTGGIVRSAAPTVSNQITDYQIEPAADDTAKGPQTNDINAGATITQWDCCYLGSAGKWLLTDADAAATSAGLLALSLESKTDTQAMNVALPGSICRNDGWTWATVGAPLYLSGTPGALTETAPSGTDDVVRVVGYVLSDDCIYFNPSNDYATVV